MSCEKRKKAFVVLTLLVTTMVLLASCRSFAVGSGYGGNTFNLKTDSRDEIVTHSGLSFSHTYLFSGKNDTGFSMYNSGLIVNPISLDNSYFGLSIGPAWLFKVNRISFLTGVGLCAGVSYKNDISSLLHLGIEGIVEGRYSISDNLYLGIKGSIIKNMNNGQEVTNDMAYNFSLMFGQDFK